MAFFTLYLQDYVLWEGNEAIQPTETQIPLVMSYVRTSTMSRFLCTKIIDSNVKKFGYNEQPLTRSEQFLLHTFTRSKRSPVLWYHVMEMINPCKRELYFYPSTTLGSLEIFFVSPTLVSHTNIYRRHSMRRKGRERPYPILYYL